MSDETDPKPAAEPSKSDSDESAAAAKEAAKDFANNANALFKGLDQKLQIYLVALAVTALCSLFFGAFKVSMKSKGDNGLGAIADNMIGSSSSGKTSPALVGLGNSKGAFGGKLAFLGAAAGIGILIWSTAARRKDPWIPLGIAGAAGLAALGILTTRIGMGGASNEFMKISINGTLLGWWLPLAGAVAATVISVQRITKA